MASLLTLPPFSQHSVLFSLSSSALSYQQAKADILLMNGIHSIQRGILHHLSLFIMKYLDFHDQQSFLIFSLFADVFASPDVSCSVYPSTSMPLVFFICLLILGWFLCFKIKDFLISKCIYNVPQLK